jgi:hypothetical protein
MALDIGLFMPYSNYIDNATETSMSKQVRKTPAQKKAFDAYRFSEKQFDRYMNSVFANAAGQRTHEEKVRAAYEACKSLGMGMEHGL